MLAATTGQRWVAGLLAVASLLVYVMLAFTQVQAPRRARRDDPEAQVFFYRTFSYWLFGLPLLLVTLIWALLVILLG